MSMGIKNALEDIGCIHNIKCGIIQLKCYNWLENTSQRTKPYEHYSNLFAKWIDIFPHWHLSRRGGVIIMSGLEINI